MRLLIKNKEILDSDYNYANQDQNFKSKQVKQFELEDSNN